MVKKKKTTPSKRSKRPSKPKVQVKLGNHIRSLREKRGWSQEKLADACDLHRTYIGGIERGERNPTIVNVEKIAGSLKVAISELFQEN